MLIFYACTALKSIAHKGQHQSRDTHFCQDVISSCETSIETNVYPNTLAKHYRLHSWVCSLQKSEIYSQDFTGCSNNPPTDCRTEQIRAQPRTNTHPPDHLISWINLSLAVKGKICVLRFSISHTFKIFLPTVVKHSLPPLYKFRVYFYGFFSLISLMLIQTLVGEYKNSPRMSAFLNFKCAWLAFKMLQF